MRESHKHLFWFLVAFTAMVWGFTSRVLMPREESGIEAPPDSHDGHPIRNDDAELPDNGQDGSESVPARTAPQTLDPGGQGKETEGRRGRRSAPTSTAPTAVGRNQAIDALLKEAIAEGSLPGAVIAYGSGRGGIEFLRAYGQRALEPNREAMTVDTIFDLASLSKATMTSIAAMQLVEAGSLDLDAPAHRYLKELRGPARTIRVRHLLLHTAGLPKVTPRREFEGPRSTAIEQLLSARPEHRPGARFRYGDTAFLWLGEILSRVTGSDLGTYAEAHIAAPIGLRSTYYGSVPEAAVARTAPTEWAAARGNTMIRGQTHDPRAYRLGGVAGNAGVFSTAGDLARLARALLLGGRLDDGRLLSERGVFNLTAPHKAGTSGKALRTLGWDVLSGYSRPRGGRLSAQAYGHGGFTGTSLWVDPGRDLFVVFLSHRVHPGGKGNVLPLIAAVTDAAVAGRMSTEAPAPARGSTLTGIDRLMRGIGPLHSRNIGLVVNRASRDRTGRRTLDLLHAHPEVRVVKVFTPEHGMSASQEGRVSDDRDPTTGLPVTSLFGATRRPTPAMLAGVDTLVFDLQDVGARFFTYMSTLRELLVAARAQGLPLIVLDRPNPIGAHIVEGPVTEPGVQTFVHYHPLPIRHGMTAGELAHLLNAAQSRTDDGPGADLQVVWMEHYCRELRFAETGLPWTPPSPNLPDPDSALLYPAVGLLESTNVSVGRGTERPFQVIGASWMQPRAWLNALTEAQLPGIAAGVTRFTPRSGPYRGREVEGIELEVVAEGAFRAVDTARVLAHTLRQTHGARFHLPDMARMLADQGTLASIRRGGAYRQPTASHILRLSAFLRERRRHLHYKSCFP